MSREERAGTPRTVPCPTCGEKSVFEPWNPWRPFCCERCRALDLGAWASESYRIPGKPAEDDASGGASGSQE
ncbi:MAG TPA: DNA gyrase inhibitor YacG [Usitatibacter sp.]|jgi:endogenous inhibitor of DNA gyrase (YacG/DUF329 family)|nr:DNA gyrase inhibitor YacG [Usitatibacter sp.]